MRILTKDIKRLATLREQMKELKAEEKEIADKLKDGLAERGSPIERDNYRMELVECQGSPRWKDAYIEVAGEEAAEELPRPTYSKLMVKAI